MLRRLLPETAAIAQPIAAVPAENRNNKKYNTLLRFSAGTASIKKNTTYCCGFR